MRIRIKLITFKRMRIQIQLITLMRIQILPVNLMRIHADLDLQHCPQHYLPIDLLLLKQTELSRILLFYHSRRVSYLAKKNFFQTCPNFQSDTSDLVKKCSACWLHNGISPVPPATAFLSEITSVPDPHVFGLP
jgi:hypothetical protein